MSDPSFPTDIGNSLRVGKTGGSEFHIIVKHGVLPRWNFLRRRGKDL
jgi:hypothetical protein